MPLTMPFTDPTAASDLASTFIWIAETNFNYAAQCGRLVFFVHRNQDAAEAGKQPLATIAFDLTPNGTPAQLDSSGNVLVSAFPSFSQLIASNQGAYDAMTSFTYNLALSRPEKFPNAQTIIPPEIVSTVPPDNGSMAATDNIVLTFNQAMLDTTVQLTFTDSSNNVVLPTVVSNVNGVITLSAQLTSGQSYTAALNNAESSTGNSMTAPHTWAFTVN